METPQEFWCADCDVNLVLSTDKGTGKFFRVSGHEIECPSGNVGQYKMVMFAICAECLPNIGQFMENKSE